ncbi:TonB-dependent receptor [Bacteroidota bacterium]
MKKKQRSKKTGTIFSRLQNGLLVMKLSILCLIISSVQVFASSNYSQTKKLNLNFKSATVQEIIAEIENQSEFEFFYNHELVENTQSKVDIDVEDMTIDMILNRLFDNENISYKIDGKHIILVAKNEANPSTNSSSTQLQQENKITGTVTDAGTGESLPGVNIVVEGTTRGAITDMDGNYSIEAPADATLVFSFVGYKKISIPVEGRNVIDVSMEKEIMALDEVVTIGYGQMQRANLTGAVATVRSDQLEKPDAPNIETLIQGRLPGVYTTSGQGLPGQPNTDILIRGLGTMNNATPLILVDGIETDLDNLNPYDIESISVLKDAASAAIYGSKAANGVILVTSKKGEAGKPSVTYNASLGYQKPVRIMRRIDSWQEAEMENETNLANGEALTWTTQQIQTLKDQSDPWNYPNTDWMDLLIQGSGFTQSHNVAVAGGNEINTFRLSAGYFNQEGIVKNTDYNRYNLRLNTSTQVTDRLKVGLNSSVAQGITTEPMSPFYNTVLTQFFRQCARIPAYSLCKDENGNWSRGGNDGNPIAWVEEGGLNTKRSSTVLGNIFSDYTLLKGLTLSGNAEFAYDIYDAKRDVNTVGPYTDGTEQGPSSVTDDVNRTGAVTLESQLRYANTFGNHGIQAMVGVSRQQIDARSTSARRNNLPSDGLTDVSAGESDGQSASGSSSEERIGSYYGRINYNFDNRYLFEANVRADGSSKFAPDYRWGTFPSFSAGWRISEESFMENIGLLNSLKLRASWGKLGNNRVSNYLWIPRINLGQEYPFGNTMASGAAQTSASIDNLTWETTTQLDIGIETVLLDNLLSLTVDYYDRYTDDILIDNPVTTFYGLPAPTVNIGAMTNSGVEVELGHMNRLGDFRYDLRGQVSFNKNVVDKFPEKRITRGGFPGTRIMEEGSEWEAYYGYQVEGIFQTDAEAAAGPMIPGSDPKAGDYKFKDNSGPDGVPDGIITADDEVIIGNYLPKIIYGLNTDFSYKNFDLSLFFQGAAKVYRNLGSQIQWPWSAAPLEVHLDYTKVANGQVTEEGHYPRLGGRGNNGQFCDRILWESSYLRLKSAVLGYNLPVSAAQKIRADNLRIYFSGSNIFTLTGKDWPKDFDPEVYAYSGRANGAYPQMAFFMFGLDVTF